VIDRLLSNIANEWCAYAGAVSKATAHGNATSTPRDNLIGPSPRQERLAMAGISLLVANLRGSQDLRKGTRVHFVQGKTARKDGVGRRRSESRINKSSVLRLGFVDKGYPQFD
jgi:hypothetical protein